MSQVDAFSEEMQKFIEKSDKRHALIIIASEPDENGESSRQTGSIMGNDRRSRSRFSRVYKTTPRT